MTREQRYRAAKQLKNNPLLREMLEERREDILETWSSEQDPEKREALWHQLQATIDLKDYFYATITKLVKSGD